MKYDKENVNFENIDFKTLPKIDAIFTMNGKKCIVKDVYPSRFGDWKVSYSAIGGSGGIVNLDYFSEHAII
jgi:hypothetical protein